MITGDEFPRRGAADSVHPNFVVHRRTSTSRGLRRCWRQPRKRGVAHFVQISIVACGTCRLSLPRVKIAAEELVRDSPVPWSIVRATGFYWLLDRMLAHMVRRRVLLLPTDVRMQPVDSDDFAEFVVGCVTDGRRGEREDFAGPETLTTRELARQYLAARALRRPIWRVPLPRGFTSALDAGNTSHEAAWGPRGRSGFAAPMRLPPCPARPPDVTQRQ